MLGLWGKNMYTGLSTGFEVAGNNLKVAGE